MKWVIKTWNCRLKCKSRNEGFPNCSLHIKLACFIEVLGSGNSSLSYSFTRARAHTHNTLIFLYLFGLVAKGEYLNLPAQRLIPRREGESGIPIHRDIPIFSCLITYKLTQVSCKLVDYIPVMSDWVQDSRTPICVPQCTQSSDLQLICPLFQASRPLSPHLFVNL